MALRYDTARFEASYGSADKLPEPTTPEVSFVGRSNVGKSSLLNRLVGRKALAKVSSTPGRTANVNFFDVDGVSFVDLPGYGYAKVSKNERQRWADLIGGYFEQERSFNLVVALVDIRLEAQKIDREMLEFLKEEELPKLSKPKQQHQVAVLSKQLDVPRSQMVVTSAETGLGIDELRRRIEDACL